MKVDPPWANEAHPTYRGWEEWGDNQKEARERGESAIEKQESSKSGSDKAET